MVDTHHGCAEELAGRGKLESGNLIGGKWKLGWREIGRRAVGSGIWVGGKWKVGWGEVGRREVGIGLAESRPVGSGKWVSSYSHFWVMGNELTGSPC